MQLDLLSSALRVYIFRDGFTGLLMHHTQKFQDICNKFRTWGKFQDISGQFLKFQEFQDNAQPCFK